MTIKEAIGALRYCKEQKVLEYDPYGENEDKKEKCEMIMDALDIAIEALENGSVENFQLKHILLLATTLNFPIENLNLTPQSFNTLHRSGFKTIGDVYSYSEDRKGLRTIRGIGEKYESEILQALNEYIIDHLPELHSEPSKSKKTGRWSKQMLFDDGYGGKKVGYICSACRKYVPFKGNYCGNCGAKMESEAG